MASKSVFGTQGKLDINLCAWVSLPIVDFASVSPLTSKVTCVAVSLVTVRQAPFIAMLSPILAWLANCEVNRQRSGIAAFGKRLYRANLLDNSCEHSN